jgi:hypothetical protein
MPADMFRDPPVPPVNPSPAKPVVVGQSNPGVNEPQRRFADMQDRNTAADPWRDPSVVLTRQADGSIVARPRSDGGSNGTPAGDGTQPAVPSDPAQRIDPVRTEDGKIVLGEGLEFTDQQLRDLVAFKASEDTRKLTVPANPTDYRVELPADLRLPAGVEFRIDPNSPMVPAAQAFAKGMALPKPSLPSSSGSMRRPRPARPRTSTTRALLKSPNLAMQ